MKKTISLLSACCMLVIFTTKVNAQEISYVSPSSLALSNVNSPVSNTNENTNSVSTKVFQEFSRDFVNATDVSWQANGQVSCLYFKQNGLPVRANYNKKGKLEYTIRYYYGAQVPSEITSLMRSKGYDMNIIHVTEIKRRYTTTLRVKMEDATSFLTIQVNPDGELSVYEEYNKAE
jgi:hypothetical protein